MWSLSSTPALLCSFYWGLHFYSTCFGKRNMRYVLYQRRQLSLCFHCTPSSAHVNMAGISWENTVDQWESGVGSVVSKYNTFDNCDIFKMNILIINLIKEIKTTLTIQIMIIWRQCAAMCDWQYSTVCAKCQSLETNPGGYWEIFLLFCKIAFKCHVFYKLLKGPFETPKVL